MDFLGDIEAALPVARRFARALIGDRAAADEVVLSCLQTALSRRIQRHRDGSVRACMLRMLVTRHRDMLRGASEPRAALVAVGGISVPAIAAPAGRFSLDEMQEVLGRLPADQRTALLLVSLESMAVAQSARILSRPRGTVLARLERARAAVGQMTGASERMTALPRAADRVPEERLALFHAGDLTRAEAQAMALRLEGDPGAQATLDEWHLQDAAIQALYGSILHEPLPQRFRDVLEAAPRVGRVRRPITLPRIGAMAVAVACLAFGLGFGWGARGYLFPADGDTTLAAARAYATYLSDPSNAVEVSALDRARLDAWIARRFGQALAAPDLSHAGFRLLGGRVLPSANGAAVLYVYEGNRGQHVALYVVHGTGSAGSVPRYFDTAGAPGFWWLGRGLSYALAGQMPRDDLRYVSGLAHDQMP